MKAFIKNHELLVLAGALAKDIRANLGNVGNAKDLWIYPVPRGGIPALYALMVADKGFYIANTPEEADIIVDDIIDSGATYNQYKEAYFDTPFYALVDKRQESCHYKNDWVVFPWEQKEDGQDEGIEQNILRILQHVEPHTTNEGELREGLQETPKRVAKALAEKLSGYDTDPASVLKVFTDGAEGCDEMVMVKDIPFHSMCEHHMETIKGVASIAYIPDGAIVGLSKLVRLLEVHSRRLQVQERLTNSITSDLMAHLKPKGAACIIEATHGCMECRGVKVQGSTTITSSLKGVFKEQPETRAEFMALATAPKRV